MMEHIIAIIISIIVFIISVLIHAHYDFSVKWVTNKYPPERIKEEIIKFLCTVACTVSLIVLITQIGYFI